MAKNPYFPLYASDFMHETTFLDDWQVVVYMKLRCMIWLHEKIDASANALVKVHNMATVFLEKLPESVKDKFLIENGVVTCPDFISHKERYEAFRVRKSDAGKAGAEARWKNKSNNIITLSHSKGIANANAFNEYEIEIESDNETFEGGSGETLADVLINPSWLLTEFQTHCNKLKPCKNLTEERMSKAIALLRKFTQEEIIAVFKKANANSFITGGGSNGWVATFDWLITPLNFTKVQENQYSGKSSTQRTATEFKPNR